MANTKRDQDLVDRLHASGIRKRTAELLADATDVRHKPAKHVRAAAKEMRKALADLEDRAKGGPARREAEAKAKRSAAAKKGAETRKKNAAKRSATAKKAGATRKKSAA